MRAATSIRISLGAVLTATAYAALIQAPPMAPRTVAVRADSSTTAVTSSTRVAVDPFVTPDPWECIRENVTQYFDVSKPTGALYDAMTSYGDMLVEPCLSTATGIDILSCHVSEATQWCGLSTAIPAAVLSDYNAYASGAYSYWAATSSKAISVKAFCPVDWSRPDFSAQNWLNLTIAFAGCYAAANPGVITSATGSMSTRAPSTPPTSSGTSAPTNSVVGRAQGIEMWILASTGMAAVAVNSVL